MPRSLRPHLVAHVRTSACLLAALVAGGCGGGLDPGGAPADGGPNPGVYPPNATPFGKTYGEWSVAWCQWALSIPKATNPMVDDSGIHAGVGQSGPVWFLAGTVGTTNERRCTIPVGKAVFFPIINGFFWVPTDASTPEELRGIAEEGLDHVTEVEAAVDGVSLRGLRNYRFQSPDIFQFTGPCGPDDEIFPNQCGTHDTFADGYYVMLEPLSPGAHDIYFRGEIVFPSTYPSTQVFEVVMTYHVTVE